MNEIIVSQNLYRVGGLLIRNRKLLLVTGDQEVLYWTPGGRLEKGETPLEALHRELREEIGIEIESYVYLGTFFGEHDAIPGEMKELGYYIVNTQDDPQPSEQDTTKIRWFSREQLQNQHIKTTPAIFLEILPKLIEEGLM